jgi:PAS domain S-box-containing protein
LHSQNGIYGLFQLDRTSPRAKSLGKLDIAGAYWANIRSRAEWPDQEITLTMPNLTPSTALLQGVVESSDDAIIGETLDGLICLWNPAAERLFGYAPAEAIGQGAQLIVPEHLLAEAQRTRTRALGGTRVEHYETIRSSKDGRPIDVSLTLSTIRDVDGVLVGLSQILRDVGNRKESERRFAHLAAVIQSSDDAIASKDLDGIVQSWNPAAEQLFGFTAAEMVGQSIRTIIPPNRWLEEDEMLRQIRNGQPVEHFETIRQRKDGTLIPISLTISPIRAAGGEIVGASKIARDMRGRAVLEREKNRLGAIVDSSDDAIVSKDLNGVVQTWNRAAERMFGYTAEEAVGRSITIIIPEDRLHEEDEVLSRIRHGQRVDHFETIRRRKDATLIPISLTVSPIHDHTGRIIGASKTARDLSALRAYATTLEQTVRERTASLEREQEALRTAGEAMRLKDEFLATLSHELRTPLNAISGWLQVIRSHAVPDSMSRGLTAIERNAGLLTRLIADLVDVSRIVGGTLTLRVQPTDVRRVLEAVLDSLRPVVETKRLSVTIEAPDELEPAAVDPDRFHQMVWNLLSNAAKFTPPNGRISVRAEPVDSMIGLSIADNGPGIRAGFLPRVFDRFSQQDAGMTREHGGLGLGLAIVRHLAEMHGGSVSVTSTEGEGATFCIRVPIADAATSAAAPTVDTGQHALLAGVHVLVVDDETDAREFVTKMLQDQGAVVTAAESAAEGFEVLARAVPDVLLCDVGMPTEDGLTFIGRIRQSDRASVASVPAVAVTAYAREQDRQQALRAGFHSHLAKPFSAHELVSIVQRLARIGPREGNRPAVG